MLKGTLACFILLGAAYSKSNSKIHGTSVFCCFHSFFFLLLFWLSGMFFKDKCCNLYLFLLSQWDFFFFFANQKTVAGVVWSKRMSVAKKKKKGLLLFQSKLSRFGTNKVNLISSFHSLILIVWVYTHSVLKDEVLTLSVLKFMIILQCVFWKITTSLSLAEFDKWLECVKSS